MLLEAVAWILIVSMGVIVALWITAAVKMLRSQRGLPHVRAALADASARDREGWPRVSVIVPAHNEEAMLDPCIHSIRAQDYANLQIIIALDRCEDASPEIAQRHADADDRVTVTPNDSQRAGWRGKCLPMQIGSEHADGQWLLFIDADTELDPTVVRAAVATAEQRGIEMLSVLPELRCRKLFEHIAQPVASLNLMLLFPPHKVNRPNGQSRAFSLGAFTLLKRETYDRVGGMAAVKDQFMEDINLARAVNAAGGEIGIASGTGLFRCVMYDHLDEFVNGWKRIFIGAAHQRVGRLRKQGRRLMTIGLGLPVIQLVALSFAWVVAQNGSPLLGGVLAGFVLLAVLSQYAVFARFYKAAGASLLAPLLFPVGSAMIGLILLRGSNDLRHGRHFTWGGHDYAPEAR